MRLENTQAAQASVFIDITDRVDAEPPEAGLLGIAFHPHFAQNGYVYLAYTRAGKPVVSYLSRFKSLDNGRTLDPQSETVILREENKTKNYDLHHDQHNIGQIAFGPDGFLYIGFGDGHEGDYDPEGNGQNTQTLFSTISRIDVDKRAPYGIPSDNPFANGQGGRPEIYAWGFRNPWRFSFDRATGELWTSDVGQGFWEEIDKVQLGKNYGWAIREGSHCLGSRVKCVLRSIKCLVQCEDLTEPVFDYDHRQEGTCAIIGGFVYRGGIPGLQGAYVYSDFCGGKIWGLYPMDTDYQRRQLLVSQAQIVSFAQDKHGEFYVIDYAGNVFRLEETKNTNQKSSG